MGEDLTAIRKQLAAREQKINDTAVAKDTAVLLELYRQQADDSRKVGNWGQFADYYKKRYALEYNEKNTSLAIPNLDSIIAHEDELLKIDTLRSKLAEAYYNRLFDLYGKDNNKVVADYEKYMTYSAPGTDAEFIYYVFATAGNAWTMIGDNQMAISILKKARQMAMEEKSTENIAWMSVNLANTYRSNEEWEQAIQTASAPLTLTGVSPERRAYLNAVLAEACIGMGKTNEALLYTNAALPFLLSLPREGDIPERLFNVYRVKADVLAAMQQPAEALRSYYQALSYYAIKDSAFADRSVGKAFIAMSRLHLSAGRTDSALHYCNRALKSLFPSREISLDNLPVEEQVYHENGIMEVMDVAAKTYRQQYERSLDVGLLQRSLQCINLAFKTEEMLRQTQIYDNSKYRQGMESRGRSELGIEVCRLLWGTTGKDKWLDEAFMYAEKGRANVLLDKIKENLLFTLRADSSFTQTRQLWYMIKNIEDKIADARRDSSSPESLTVLIKEKESIEAQFAKNKNRVNNLLQDEYKKRAISIPVTDIRNKLLNNYDAIIEYFAGDSLLYRFVIQKGKENVEISAVPLKAADALVQTLLPYLTDKDKYNNAPGEYNRMAAQLHQMIFPSLGDNKKEMSRVVIVADGSLQFFPFEALMTNTATPSFLVQQFRFTAAFSCASLLQQMNMAGGVFDADGIAFAPFINKAKDDLPALPQTGAEAESLRNAGDVVNIFKNENATSKRFMEQAGKGKILHLASHSFADGSDSVQPRIEFADGSLSLEKIYALQLSNRLVVLSACQTGIGKLVTAEGALSLARGFYYSGAKNVINSLWEVDDQSAGQIFEKFYRHLKKTGSIDRSLALARQEYIKEAPVEKRSPYYWASFVCIGDGVYEEPKDNTRLILICVGGLLGLLILMIIFRRSPHK